MSLGQIVGRGRLADVYEWLDGSDDPPKVLKLCNPQQRREVVERERLFSCAAWDAGVPTPRVFGPPVEHGGRFGILYERIEGPTLGQVMTSRPARLKSCSRLLGELHAKVLAARAPGLPTLKDLLRHKLAEARTITPEEKAQLGDILDSMPDGDRLCHGDFHPDNVIFRADDDGGPVVIDWGNASVDRPSRCLV